jgi:quercetin dioxygenase-like cupin family protein
VLRGLLLIALAAALIAACDRGDQGAASTTARAWQAQTIDLAGGRLSALPSGSLFVRVVEFAQDAGSAFTSHQHVPGFVYVDQGLHRLVITDGPSIDLAAGDAFFLGSLTHEHLNPAAAPNHWYFVALWPTSARSAALVDASAGVPFATPDLPATALPPGAYASTLRLVTLAPGGRTPAHEYGGLEVLFVLEGAVSIHAAGAAPATLSAGQGIHHLPHTVAQEFNARDEASRYLEWLLTADGQPFQTNVQHSP